MMVKDAYPLPVIDDLSDALGYSDWFSGLGSYTRY